MKQLIGLTSNELSKLCESMEESKFRGKQLAEWIYKKNCNDLSEIKNLPAQLIKNIQAEYEIGQPKILDESKSADGTTKILFGLQDNQQIESVLLPYTDRISACISTQVGCPVGCTFCATGSGGYVRNLTAGEIVGQVLALQKYSGKRITHVVFMGMGEPLLNFKNTVKAVNLLNDEIGISIRKITISTVGIPDAIKKLANMDLGLTLAVSLHSANDDLRSALIPTSNHKVKEILWASREYAERTSRRVTFEYLMIEKINDSLEQAEELAALLVHPLLKHVNLIPYNEVEGKDFKRSSKADIKAFKYLLERKGITVTQRFEKGTKVNAACGQLRSRSKPTGD